MATTPPPPRSGGAAAAAAGGSAVLPLETLTCIICQELAYPPVESACCGAMFCKSCVSKMCMHQGGNVSCAQCRADCVQEGVSSIRGWLCSKMLERKIGEIEVVSGLQVGDQIVISSIDIFNNRDQIYLTN